MPEDVKSALVTVTSTYPYISRRLIRPKPESFCAGAFKVYLDGKCVGVLPALGNRAFEVAPGSHTLRMRFRWYLSRRHEFHLAQAEKLEFSTTIPKSLTSMARLIFRPLSAVELAQLTQTQP